MLSNKKIPLLIFTLLVLLNSPLSCFAYYFATDVETKIVALDEKNISLEVTQLDDEDDEEVFPVGTILKGRFFEYSFNKHFLRDEYLKIHLYEAKLANGQTQAIDNDIKIKPRAFLSAKHGLQLSGAALGTVLKLTVAIWSVGFPTGRGIKAVTDAAYAVYDTPEKESKWKQGAKGFVKGALFPLPELVMKGQKLPIHDESFIWIQDADEDEKRLSAFIVKRKNIYLSKNKYYDAKGTLAPDYTQYLDEKDYKKYQKKLAKKGVKAKIKEKKHSHDEVEIISEPQEEELEMISEPLKEVQVEEPVQEEESKLEEHDESSDHEHDEIDDHKRHKHLWQRRRKPRVIFENH